MNSMIITGGRIDLPFAKTILDSQAWDLVISTDPGLHFCLESGVIPDVILGDFDSVEPMELAYAQEHYPERLYRFPAEKDETDTELAVDCALRAGADRITILGGTGDRLDHVLGNVQMLKKALDAGAECVLLDPHNRIRMICEDLTMDREEQFGDYVSLIPFTPAVEGLSLTGFVYEVEDLTLQSGTARGISNEIRDEKALISFRSGILLVIESRD